LSAYRLSHRIPSGEGMMTQQRQDPDPRAWGETKHQIGDSNIRPFGLDIRNPVFMI